jgi:uncharacterized repeat protein (TIGR03803 family)
MSTTLMHIRRGIVVCVIAVTPLLSQRAAAQEQTLYSFSGGTDGRVPNSLVLGADGNLYGTAAGGGAYNAGVVFRLTPVSGGGWTFSVIHDFTAGHDGAGPQALIFGPDGNLYGTAYDGGNVNCPSGCGTVFKMTPTSGSWQLSVIHTFKGRLDGHFPTGLTFDAAGNLYGTTFNGGTSDVGVVYQLVPTASGPWTENLLYTFTGGHDGEWPSNRLAIDGAGNVYGTTLGGGVSTHFGFGTAFKIAPVNGGGWQYTMILAFQGSEGRGPGAYPDFGVITDGAGNLYGTTGGGDGDAGDVFRLEPPIVGTAWRASVLHFFNGGVQGGVPNAVVLDASGALWGIANGGGNTACKSGCGTIFSLQPAASGAWPFTLLYSFTGASDGNYPNSLISDAAGNLYGTTGGVLVTGTGGVVFELPAAQ